MLELTIHFLHAEMVSVKTRVGVANHNAGFTSSYPLSVSSGFNHKIYYKLLLLMLLFINYVSLTFKADTCSMAAVTTTEERTLRL